jgi:hypothetical protein
MPRAARVPRDLSFVPFAGSRAIADGLLTLAMLRLTAARSADSAPRTCNALRAAGWLVLRFTATGVLRNPVQTAQQVATAIRERHGGA